MSINIVSFLGYTKKITEIDNSLEYGILRVSKNIRYRTSGVLEQSMHQNFLFNSKSMQSLPDNTLESWLTSCRHKFEQQVIGLLQFTTFLDVDFVKNLIWKIKIRKKFTPQCQKKKF